MEYNRIELFVYGTIEKVKAEIEVMKCSNAMTDPSTPNFFPEEFTAKAEEIKKALDMLCIQIEDTVKKVGE